MKMRMNNGKKEFLVRGEWRDKPWVKAEPELKEVGEEKLTDSEEEPVNPPEGE